MIPVQCSWYKSTCAYYDCSIGGNCPVIPISDGPNGNGHNIATNYTITISDIVIPLIRTARNFNVSYAQTFGSRGLPLGYFNSDGDMLPLYCTELPPNQPTCTVTENCTIETSTLYFIDHRYNVCLYKYIKDELHLSKNSTEMALIKEPFQIGEYHQIQIKTSDYTATRLTEWRLINNGVETMLASTTENLEPFGPRNNGLPSGTGLYPNYAPDPETRLVLLFPQPPSLGIPWSDVICRLGFYDYGNDPGEESQLNKLDGGNKDMFYPEWCRNLQQDSLWRQAADNRYNISWFHADLTNDTSYVPPSISVQPIPIGSFANHPQVGNVYQFLCDANVYGNRNFNDLIDNALKPAKMVTHDTTLYYPIGVI